MSRLRRAGRLVVVIRQLLLTARETAYIGHRVPSLLVT